MDSSTHANKFVQQLKYFEIFFSSEKSIRNLNENFFKNFSTILRLTDSLYCKIKDDENLAQEFIHHNGIDYFVRLLGILTNVNQYDTIIDQCHNPAPIGENFDSKNLMRMEFCLLSCIYYLLSIDKWQEVTNIFVENEQYLSCLYHFLNSFHLPCQTMVLKIFAKISLSETGVEKLLNKSQVIVSYPTQGFLLSVLINKFNYANTDITPQGIKYHIIDLFVQMLKNKKHSHKILLQNQMEEEGFFIEQLEDIDVPPSEELWSKLKELKHLCSDCPKVILSEASQLEQKMEKLKQALNRLQLKKNSLLLEDEKQASHVDSFQDSDENRFCFPSKNSNQKNRFLLKNIDYFSQTQSYVCSRANSNSSFKSLESNPMNMVNNDGVYDFNVKSCEEELVYTSVTLPCGNDTIGLSISPTNPSSKQRASVNINSLPQSRNNFPGPNRFNMDCVVEQQPPPSSVFPYIELNQNNELSRDHGKSFEISDFSEMDSTENRTSVYLEDSNGTESICSLNVDSMNWLKTSNKMPNQSERTNSLKNCMTEYENSETYDSLTSAFQSNFILRKNDDIYLSYGNFPQNHLNTYETSTNNIEMDHSLGETLVNFSQVK